MSGSQEWVDDDLAAAFGEWGEAEEQEGDQEERSGDEDDGGDDEVGLAPVPAWRAYPHLVLHATGGQSDEP